MLPGDSGNGTWTHGTGTPAWLLHAPPFECRTSKGYERAPSSRAGHPAGRGSTAQKLVLVKGPQVPLLSDRPGASFRKVTSFRTPTPISELRSDAKIGSPNEIGSEFHSDIFAHVVFRVCFVHHKPPCRRYREGLCFC